MAAAARQVQQAAEGAYFVVLADETRSALEVNGYEKLSHTNDFSEFGLPSFPADQVLWYNADYPLYCLQKRFPEASHIAMVEYDVMINIPLLPVFNRAKSEGVDLIAHYICDAEPGWEWTARVGHHFAKTMQAFLPFVIVSSRAIRYLLSRRLIIPKTKLRTFEDWPFCEAFIPSALAEVSDMNMQELGKHAALPHYTLASTLHPQNPKANKAGTIAHPVKVTRNVALGKPAKQSSVHPWWNAISTEHDAASGNNGIIGQAAGFNTAPESNPWWEVDLLEDCNVVEVIIHNRLDAPVEVFRLVLSVSIHGEYWMPLATGSFEDRSSSLIFKLSRPVTARHLRLTRVGFGELHLDEIEVFDT